jgi:hypothetical protein
MTNQKFRGGSTNKILEFICLYSCNWASIEIDFHLLKATRNLEKKKRSRGIKRTSAHLIPSMHENKIRCFIMVLLLSVYFEIFVMTFFFLKNQSQYVHQSPYSIFSLQFYRHDLHIVPNTEKPSYNGHLG